MRANNRKLDYALTAFYSCLALYAAGAGINNIALALTLMSLCVLGSLASYLFCKIDKTNRLDGYSGIAYALTAAAVIFFIVPLNSMLPGGGFPTELIIAAVMCWLITLGAFLAWSENVMLFQAVPSLSLLSMVGIWETYSGAVLTFVLFLLSVTVLLSRAHTRTMYRLAEESGYKTLGAISDGPWRRMAGPEWVLGFAALVIVLSSIGAPIVQNLFKPFAGNFRDSIPKAIVQKFNQVESMAPTSTVRSNIGTGPHTPGDRVMLLAELDRPRYLKDGFFEVYAGNGWQKDPNATFPDDRVWQEGNRIYRQAFSQKIIKAPEIIQYTVIPMSGTVNRVPVPGDAFEIRMQIDGKGSRFKNGVLDKSTLPKYLGLSYAPNPRVVPSKAVHIEDPVIRDAYTLVSTTERVRNFAEKAALGKKTDYAKALAIKDAIASTAKYNLKAAAVPTNVDAIDYFLFESKEGYCDLFATAMVVMSRCVGIPARYVTGYYPIKNEKDGMGRTVLRSSDRHAWAELFFEGVGWISFDATEGALEIAGNERGSSGIQTPWYETRAFQLALNVIMAVAVVGLLILGLSDRLNLKPLFAWRSVKAPLDRSVEIRKILGTQYASLAKAIARSTGIPRPAHMSLTEYASLAGPRLGPLQERLSHLTEHYVFALYSDASVEDSELKEIGQETRKLRSDILRLPSSRKPSHALSALMRPFGNVMALARAIKHLHDQDKRDFLMKKSSGISSKNKPRG